MTIRLPKQSIGDRILEIFGKRRAIKIPRKGYEQYGPYVYMKASKESFWGALLRPKNRRPPEGFVYMDELKAEPEDGIDS
jgi:hypothetical protein